MSINSGMMEFPIRCLGTGLRSRNVQQEANPGGGQVLSPEVEATEATEAIEVVGQLPQDPRHLDTSIMSPLENVEATTTEEDAELGATEASKSSLIFGELMSSLMWWNCAGGVISKIDFIKDLCKTNKPRPLVVFISESNIDQHLVDLVKIDNFSILTAGTIQNGKSRVV